MRTACYCQLNVWWSKERAGDTAPYVNQVRARAGLPAVTTINAEVVANERRHELAFENHRWYDLLRTGKAIEVMTAYGKYIKTIDTELPERTYQIKPEYLLYPIPYNELQLNDQLKQNPGYYYHITKRPLLLQQRSFYLLAP